MSVLKSLVIVSHADLVNAMDTMLSPLLWYELTEEMLCVEIQNDEKTYNKRGAGELAFSLAINENPASDQKGIDFINRRAEVKVLFNAKGKHSSARVGAISTQFRKSWRTDEMRKVIWNNSDVEHVLYDDINVNDFQRLMNVLNSFNVNPTPHDLFTSANIDWLVIHGKTSIGQLVVHRSIANDLFEFESITQNRLKISVRPEHRTDLEKLMKHGPSSSNV